MSGIWLLTHHPVVILNQSGICNSLPGLALKIIFSSIKNWIDFANSLSSVWPLTHIFDTSFIQYGMPIVPSFTIVNDVVAVAPEYCNSSS